MGSPLAGLSVSHKSHDGGDGMVEGPVPGQRLSGPSSSTSSTQFSYLHVAHQIPSDQQGQIKEYALSWSPYVKGNLEQYCEHS